MLQSICLPFSRSIQSSQYLFKSSKNVGINRIANFFTNRDRKVRFRSQTNVNSSTDDELIESQGLSETKVSAKQLLEDAAAFQDQIPDNEESKWLTSPYPKGSIPRSQAHHSLRPRINPLETSIILFPGEGSQYVGMGKDLFKFPACRDIFEIANEILQFNLIKMCLQGPKSELDKLPNSQVAILVSSLATVERLKEERPSAIDNCITTAGYGIGELTALVFSGVISFERAVRLAQLRGEAMQMASEMVAGGMMTIMYGPNSKVGYALLKAVESAAAAGVEKPHCSIAYYLFPHCKVIAGNVECLNFLENNKDDFGIKEVRRLPVGAALHCHLMRPAAEPFKKALRKSKFNEPMIAVHSCCDGKRYRDEEHVVKQLPKQIYKPVKWEQILHVLYERPDGENFPKTYECGPGDSLKRILKMVNAKAWNSCVSVLT